MRWGILSKGENGSDLCFLWITLPPCCVENRPQAGKSRSGENREEAMPRTEDGGSHHCEGASLRLKTNSQEWGRHFPVLHPIMFSLVEAPVTSQDLPGKQDSFEGTLTKA